MTRRNLILILAATTALSALALTAARARDVPKVATGFVANILCSETFMSGQPPEKIFTETMAAMPGVSLITWAMGYHVDRARRDVTVTLFGLGKSHAVYRDGLGCYLDHGDAVAEASVPAVDIKPSQVLLPDIAGPAVVVPATPQLAAALDRAFAEPEQPPLRHTRAVLVLKDGHVVAERYADGFGIETPILGFSSTKSVISALTGILVRKGALTLDQPAPVAAWRSPDDVRHAITVDHLLRHTAGLAIGSSLEASLGSAFEPVNRMKFVESDMAAYAETVGLATSPGSAWNYNDGNFIVLSHLIRNAAGGRAADVMRFARQELFAPLGMRNVTIEFDASGQSGRIEPDAGQCARLGALRHALSQRRRGRGKAHPARRLGKILASPTPNAWVGYGAGFWTNLGDSFGAAYRVEHGWPRDAYFAKGTIGQYVIIIPSERLVIVRLGRSPNWPPEVDGVFDLVRDMVAATGNKARLAGSN